MAYVPDQTSPSTGDAAMRRIKDRWVLGGGWSVMASGDGASAYGASSDVITADSGANSFANYTSGSSSAWIRLRMTGSTRELLIIRGTNSTTWTVKYSLLGFSGGSPSATAAPTATDQQTVYTAATQIFPADGTYQLSIVAENAAPYYSAASFKVISDSSARAIFGVLPLLSGSYPAEDTDPYVVTAWYAAPVIVTNYTQSACTWSRAWSRPGLGGATWCNAPLAMSETHSSTAPLHAIASKDLAPPVPVMLYSGSAYGPKGTLRDVRSALSSLTASPNGTHLVDGSDYFMRFGPLWVRWDSTAPL